MYDLLTADEVAKILKVKKARVYELARQGKLPAVRLGRQIRFDAVGLDAWVRAGGSPHESCKP